MFLLTIKMAFIPQDGMKVLVSGKISVYEAVVIIKYM